MEFEYPIPAQQAEQLLNDICVKPVLVKTRHIVMENRRRWEIDEYSGENEGLIVAEIEIKNQNERIPKPAWLGKEISGDERFSNLNLVAHPYRTWQEGPADPENAFHIKKHEQLSEGLARVIHEQLSGAVRVLRKSADNQEEAIHEARKALKRARAVLRLARPVLGSAYSSANSELRDVGRKLSEVRDAQALIETVDRLKEDQPKKATVRALTKIHQKLDRRKQDCSSDFANRGETERIINHLESVQSGIGTWPLEKADAGMTILSVETTVRRGTRACEHALADGEADGFHEWRKRSKDLRYQLELLKNLWPEVLEGYSDSAKELEQLLGEDHNLAVLIGVVKSDQHYAKSDLDLLTPLVHEEQGKLRKKAEAIGHVLYGEKPKQWAKRLDRCWQNWKNF
jgi:CHAD domain-containing protein